MGSVVGIAIHGLLSFGLASFLIILQILAPLQKGVQFWYSMLWKISAIP